MGEQLDGNREATLAKYKTTVAITTTGLGELLLSVLKAEDKEALAIIRAEVDDMFNGVEKKLI
ncbi:MAG: hypothetical protein ACOZBW_11225 [Thermodesulfobacteriota bacterium]